MQIVYPIRLDDPVYYTNMAGELVEISTIDEQLLDSDKNFIDEFKLATRVNGYDSSSFNSGKGIRLTNLTGVKGGDALKWCPACNKTGTQTVFTLDDPRHTNEHRDQSHCVDCRADYK